MEEWQNGHDQPGYHYHQEQDKKRKPIETPGKRFWKMWGPLLIKWGIGSHDDGIYEDTLSDAGSIRGVDV